jgi:hypothetical protein
MRPIGVGSTQGRGGPPGSARHKAEVAKVGPRQHCGGARAGVGHRAPGVSGSAAVGDGRGNAV